MARNTTNRFSPEVRARAVWLAFEHVKDHPSRWATVTSIAAKIGCTAQSLNEWVKKAEIDGETRVSGESSSAGNCSTPASDLAAVEKVTGLRGSDVFRRFRVGGGGTDAGRGRAVGFAFSYVDLEARVGKDHPLRTIRAIVNEALSSLSAEFSALCAPSGHPSIPPENLLRAMLSQAFYSIRSERQLIERLRSIFRIRTRPSDSSSTRRPAWRPLWPDPTFARWLWARSRI
jgi:transposase-like protein